MAVSHSVSDLQETQNWFIKHTNNVSSLEERSRILKKNLVPHTRYCHLILKPHHTIKQHKDIPGLAIIRPPDIAWVPDPWILVGQETPNRRNPSSDDDHYSKINESRAQWKLDVKYYHTTKFSRDLVNDRNTHQYQNECLNSPSLLNRAWSSMIVALWDGARILCIATAFLTDLLEDITDETNW